jgi:hypothetical protein
MKDEKRAADDAEREDFEFLYATPFRLPVDRTVSDERYCSMETEHAYRAWCMSRAALSARADGGKDSSDAARWRYAIEQDWLTSAEVKAIDAAIAGDKK